MTDTQHAVLLSDELSAECIEVFRKAGITADYQPKLTQDQIRDCIGKYSGWVIRSRSRATKEILEKADKLQVIGRAGVGVDNVDVPAATRRGIIVMNTPAGNTVSTAEHTCAMMMSLARKIPQAHASMVAGLWDKKSFMGMEFDGKTLGILGLGRIGQEVATRMKAFRMRILAFDPQVSPERMRAMGIEVATVDEICQRADVITVHTPLSAETRNLINADRLKSMKKTALLVNCARGGIIDEGALADALEAGTIAGAAIDVFEGEPIPADHRLRKVKNIVVTPHIAASTVEAQENVAVQVAEQIVDVLHNGNIRNAVNAPSIDPEVLRTVRPYLELGEKLGRFASQFAKSRATRIVCSYAGSALDHPMHPMTTAIAKGFIEPTEDTPVNYVNALAILHDRGVEIHETRKAGAQQHQNLVTVDVTHEDGSTDSISGSVRLPDTIRIVDVNGKHFDARPYGDLIVIENRDVPGIIGSVGTYFGKNNINISQLTWGATEDPARGAVTVINVDSPVTESVLADLRNLPNITNARLIRL